MLCLWSFGQIIESKWSQTGNLTWATEMAHKSWESWETKRCTAHQGIWKTDNMKFFYKIFPWWGCSLRNQQYEFQQMLNTFNYIMYVCVYTYVSKYWKLWEPDKLIFIVHNLLPHHMKKSLNNNKSWNDICSDNDNRNRAVD